MGPRRGPARLRRLPKQELCITAGGASKASGTCGYTYINKGALFEDACFVIRETAGSLWSPALNITEGGQCGKDENNRIVKGGVLTWHATFVIKSSLPKCR